ncbi:hypothetical protein K0038_03130 [Pseudomonas syringae]|nr:hypothetical protein [Pseudomonas syringae]
MSLLLCLLSENRLLVTSVGAMGQGNVTTFDAASGIDRVVTGGQIKPVARLYQACVDQIAAGDCLQVIGGVQRADVIEVLPGDQRHILTGNQRTGRTEAIVGLRQIQHRHQLFFAIHLVLFPPDDVVG